jgi:hypothetical protein
VLLLLLLLRSVCCMALQLTRSASNLLLSGGVRLATLALRAVIYIMHACANIIC